MSEMRGYFVTNSGSFTVETDWEPVCHYEENSQTT